VPPAAAGGGSQVTGTHVGTTARPAVPNA